MNDNIVQGPRDDLVIARHPEIPGSGTSLIEIIIALFVMVTALLPIFGLMTKDAQETNGLISTSFATDRARMVLSSVIDEIPFGNLLPGIPAKLTDSVIAGKLFPGCATSTTGSLCDGIASDSRGIHYRIIMKSEPILDNNPGYENGELTFSVYMNPNVETQNGWKTVATFSIQTEAGGEPSRYDKSGALNPGGVLSPYRYFGAAAVNRPFWGPEEEAQGNIHRYCQRDLHLANPDGKFYLMQRIVLEVRWNTAISEFSKPDSLSGRPQRLQVMTFKADLF